MLQGGTKDGKEYWRSRGCFFHLDFSHSFFQFPVEVRFSRKICPWWWKMRAIMKGQRWRWWNTVYGSLFCFEFFVLSDVMFLWWKWLTALWSRACSVSDSLSLPLQSIPIFLPFPSFFFSEWYPFITPPNVILPREKLFLVLYELWYDKEKVEDKGFDSFERTWECILLIPQSLA